MEAVASAAAVVAVINLSKDVIEWIVEFGRDVSRASKEAAALSDQLSVLTHVLEKIKDLGSSHVLDLLHQSLHVCEDDISKIQSRLYIGTGSKKAVRSLKWPFKQKDIEKSLKKLKGYIEIFNLAFTSDGIARLEKLDQISSTSNSILNEVGQVKQLALETNTRVQEFYANPKNQKEQILSWLLKVNFKSNHTTAFRSYQPGTGDWFLSGDNFATWLDDSADIQGPAKRLWLSGIAGTGKTILMSAVINAAKDHFKILGSDTQSGLKTGVAYFYFDFSDSSKQSVANMLSCLVWQLVDQLEFLPNCVIDLRRETPTSENPDIDSLLICLEKLSSSFKAIVILIDALDEASPSAEILDVVVRVNAMLPSSGRLLVSSRDEVHIKTHLLDAGLSQVMIPKSNVDRDIAAYVSERLKTDLKNRFDPLPYSLRRDIYNTLTSQSQGMFLWAHLQLNEIFLRKTNSEKRSALSSMPTDLNATYKRIGEQISERDRKWVKRTMVWLAASLEPMHHETLSEALMINQQTFDISPERLSDSNLIFDMCRSLVSMQDDGSVALVHLSLKHFLVSGDAGDFGIMGTKAMHLIAARVCFAYLTSERHDPDSWVEFRGLEHFKRYRDASNELSFLDYCCRHTFGHLKQDPTVEAEFVDLLPQIFKTPESRQHFNESFRFWETHSYEVPRYSFQNETGFSISFGPSTDLYGSLGLCWNSTLISRLVVAQTRLLIDDSIERTLDFIEEDEHGWSAICFAAALGDLVTLKSMINKLSESDQNLLRPLGSALIASVGCGTSASVSLLLDTLQKNVAILGSPELALLHEIIAILSSILGDGQTLQQILDSFPVRSGVTGFPSLQEFEALQIALVAAALEGHKQCVLQILNFGIRPETSPSPIKYQSLWYANIRELFSVANNLWLGRETVMPELQDESERTDGLLSAAGSSMTAAAMKQDRELLQILSMHCANKFDFVPDWKYNTTHSYSYSQPYVDLFEIMEPILRPLLNGLEKTEEHNAKLNQVLLWCTDKQGRDEILAKLLASGADANTMSADDYMTPLINATRNNDIAAMEILLRNGADPDTRADSWPSGAIGAAIHLGLISALRTLLSHRIDVNFKGDQKRNSPLIAACSRQPQRYFRTPDEMDPTFSMVQDLLKTGSDPNTLAVDGDYGTPLIAACALGHFEVIESLLAYGSDPNIKADRGMYGTALIAAAQSGNAGAIEALLKKGAHPNLISLPSIPSHEFRGSRNKRPQYGNALIAAAENGTLRVLELLLDQQRGLNPKIDEFTSSNKYGTPLIAAVHSRKTEAVEFLLTKGADPNFEGHSDTAEFCTAPVTAFMVRNNEAATVLSKCVTPANILKYPAFWATALVANIVNDNDIGINLLLDMGVPVNQRIDMEDTEFREYGLPIIAAVAKGRFDIFMKLVAHGADFSVENVGNYGNCLTAAVVSGDLKLVTYLLDLGASPNSLNFHREYWSPFVAAACKGHLEILKTLIERGGNPDVFYSVPNISLRESLPQEQETPLFEVLESTRLWDDIHLTSYDISPARRVYNQSVCEVLGHPLIAAIINNHDEVFHHLLKAGLNVNLRTTSGESRSPLIAALQKDRLDMARTLIEEGADAHAAIPHDRHGSAVISAASVYGLDAIYLLQELEIDFDPTRSVPNCILGSMLIAASKKTRSDYWESEKELRFIRALLEEGCNPQEVVKGSLYGSAVITAASELHLDFIQEFLKHGADLNRQTDEGLYGYPLLAAIARESLTHMKFKHNLEEEAAKFKFVHGLLKLGANPNVTYNNRTPLILAMEHVRNYDGDIVKALIDRGAEINKVVPRWLGTSSEDGRSLYEEYSALTAAAEQEKHDVVNILLKYGGDPKLLPVGYRIRESSD